MHLFWYNFFYLYFVRNVLLLILFIGTITLFANPLLIGDWNGFIVQKYETDNPIFLPCTLNISSISSSNQFAGMIEISFKHANGKVYKSKATVSGNFDTKDYKISFVDEQFVYQDLLPEKAKWCLGMTKGGFYRSKTAKQYLIKGLYTTKCSADVSLLVVYKK